MKGHNGRRNLFLQTITSPLSPLFAMLGNLGTIQNTCWQNKAYSTLHLGGGGYVQHCIGEEGVRSWLVRINSSYGTPVQVLPPLNCTWDSTNTVLEDTPLRRLVLRPGPLLHWSAHEIRPLCSLKTLPCAGPLLFPSLPQTEPFVFTLKHL